MTEQNKDIKYYMKDIYEYTTKNLSRKTLLELYQTFLIINRW